MNLFLPKKKKATETWSSWEYTNIPYSRIKSKRERVVQVIDRLDSSGFQSHLRKLDISDGKGPRPWQTISKQKWLHNKPHRFALFIMFQTFELKLIDLHVGPYMISRHLATSLQKDGILRCFTTPNIQIPSMIIQYRNG